MRVWAGIVLAVAVLALLPLVIASNFLVNFLVLTMFAAFLGQSWNIAGGYGGQFSFGHVVFFGTGAYCSTILQMRFGVNPWIGFALAAVAGAAVGALVGFLAFRAGLRGSYFALITLAFAEVFRIVANSIEITGAGTGMLIPFDPRIANFQFPSKVGFYYVVLVLTLAACGIAWWLEHSRFGARLMAIRENEDAAMALGVDCFRTKLAALALSGALAGLGGSFYAQYFLYIDPPIAYGVDRSVEMLLVPMIGGAGTVLGPVIGALVLQTVGEVTRSWLAVPGVALMLYGLILVLIVGFLPNGLIGLTRWRRRRPKAAAAPGRA